MVAAAVALACLVPATAACLGYLVPTLAGLRRRRAAPRVPTHTFTVLVPAHDEEHTLPATLRSLAALDYPPELVRVCVIADNCTDGTAMIAREAGVQCVERHDPAKRGKGYALAFGLARVLCDPPDVVLILDADCELNPDAVRAFDAMFAAGTDAVQAAVRSRNADDGPAGFVAAVGAAFDAATASGWDALGFAVPLRGTGMAFRASVFARVPWDAFGVVEDAEYAQRLKRAAVRVRYCAGAEVACDAPPSVADLCLQRRRWRGAGLLASKPLVLAHLALTAAVSFACGFVLWPAALVLVFALLYLRAVCAVGITRKRFGLLFRSPAVVSRLGWVTLSGVVRRAVTWERTPREARMTFARRTRWATRALLAPFARTRCAGSLVSRGLSPAKPGFTAAPGILLTFDDGPHPEHTPAVLDRLAAAGVTAAFFLVGNRVTDPALVERIASAGHALGNHTFAHAVGRWGDTALSLADVRRCQAVVPGATLFRPPLGRLTPGLWLAARRLKLQCVNWSLDSGDWRCRSEADALQCAKEVLEVVRPGDIVLFHDDHRWIGPILDAVLPALTRSNVT